MTSMPFLDQCRPPWVVFPDLDPSQLVGYLRQGVTEAYFFNHWRPFWNSLDDGQRTLYLDHWQASAEWREALAFHFEEEPGFDAEADVRESEDHQRRRTEEATRDRRKSWWARLFPPRR